MQLERFGRMEKAFKILDRLRLKRWQWSVLTVIFVGADIAIGPSIHFPVLFLIPIILAAWSSGIGPGLALAGLLGMARLTYGTVGWDDWLTVSAYVNAAIRVLLFSLIAALTWFSSQIRVMRGILAICSHCKRIRDSRGAWVSIEDFIALESEALCSHGLCPECIRVYYANADEAEPWPPTMRA